MVFMPHGEDYQYAVPDIVLGFQGAEIMYHNEVAAACTSEKQVEGGFQSNGINITLIINRSAQSSPTNPAVNLSGPQLDSRIVRIKEEILCGLH